MRRPAAFKAIVASLLVHAVALSVAGMAWTRPLRDFSLAGQRQVVQIELTFAEPSRSPDEPVQVAIAVEPLSPPVESEPPFEPSPSAALIEMPATEKLAPELPTTELPTTPLPTTELPTTELPTTELPTTELTARQLPAARLEETLPDRELLDRELLAPELPHNEISPSVERLANNDLPPVRAVAVAAQTPIDALDTPVKVERQQRELPPSPPLVMVPQIAGMDEREPPDFAGNRPPAYPLEAVRRQLEGTVLLRLRIADSGRVEGVDIVKSSGHAILDQSAVAAVLSWQGRPARQGGQPIATEEVLPVRFRL